MPIPTHCQPQLLINQHVSHNRGMRLTAVWVQAACSNAADDADDSLGSIPPCSTTSKSQMASAVCLALKAEGMASTNPSHPDLRHLLENGAAVDSFVQAARDMRERGNLPLSLAT